jgi:hypothetical protein
MMGLGVRSEWVDKAKPRQFYPRKRDLVAIVQEMCEPLGLSGGCGKSRPTGIHSKGLPDKMGTSNISD